MITNISLKLFAVFLLSISSFLPLHGHQKKFGLEFSGGFGYVPLKDWISRSEKSGEEVQKWNPAIYGDTGFRINLRRNQYCVLKIEYIKTAASTYGIDYFVTTGGDTIGMNVYTSDVIFQTFPTGIDYEIHFPHNSQKFDIVLGCGVSYLFTQIQIEKYSIYSTIILPNEISITRINAKGYSISGFVGVEIPLSQKFSIFSNIRGRYSDGAASLESDNPAKVKFTGVDYTSGFLYHF